MFNLYVLLAICVVLGVIWFALTPKNEETSYEKVEPEIGDLNVVSRSRDATKMTSTMLWDLAYCFDSMRDDKELSAWKSADDIRDYMNNKYSLNKSTRTYYNYRKNFTKYLDEAIKRENEAIADSAEEHF